MFAGGRCRDFGVLVAAGSLGVRKEEREGSKMQEEGEVKLGEGQEGSEGGGEETVCRESLGD
jgi:hypothetical protein